MYRDCWYDNRVKVHGRKRLHTDWPWTHPRMYSNLLHTHSYTLFIKVLGRNVFWLWLSHHITVFQSMTIVCEIEFSEAQYCLGLTNTILPGLHFLGLLHMKSHLRGTRFPDVKEIQDNTSKQPLAIQNKTEFQVYFF